MNDELAAISGKYDELVGRLQEKYGIPTEETQGRIEEFKKAVERLKRSNAKLIRLQEALHKKGTVGRKARRHKESIHNGPVRSS